MEWKRGRSVRRRLVKVRCFGKQEAESCDFEKWLVGLTKESGPQRAGAETGWEEMGQGK